MFLGGLLAPFSDVDLALAEKSGATRVDALRRLAALPPLHWHGLGAGKARIQNALRRRNWCELDLVAALRSDNAAGSIQLLAILADLPPRAACLALENDDVRFLLMICRAVNFAWSTNVALLQLRQKTLGRTCFDALQLEAFGQWYDLQKRDRAERALRFIRMRLWARKSTTSS